MYEDLATLKLAKIKCERDLLFFTRYFFKARFGTKFIVNEHHIKICEALQRVVDGKTRNLVINMPPRYGKTELAVINFIAWAVARNPKSKFIHLSYSDDLVLDNSGQIKELIQSEEFQTLWGVELKTDSQSKKKWYTTSGGGMYATAAGGAITGFGAGSATEDGFTGAIVIDDPLKVDDADSDVEREKVNRRLVTTIQSRRNSKKTPIIIIMQRLHEDDMTGFVERLGMGEEFEMLRLKAIQDDGTALWPAKHDVEDLMRMKAADAYMFSGQYMQDPTPEDGEYFKRDWIQWYDKPPEHMHYYGASDYAVTEGDGDYTVHGVVGVDPNDNVYLVDWWKGQASSDVWIEAFINLMEKWQPLGWAEEQGQIVKSLGPFIRKRMYERKVNGYRVQYASTNDKPTRARAIQGRLAMKKVYFPKNKAWASDVVNEMMKFPLGKHDDQIDVLSLFGRMLAGLRAGMVPNPKPEDPAARMKLTPTYDEFFKMGKKKQRNKI